MFRKYKIAFFLIILIASFISVYYFLFIFNNGNGIFSRIINEKYLKVWVLKGDKTEVFDDFTDNIPIIMPIAKEYVNNKDRFIATSAFYDGEMILYLNNYLKTDSNKMEYMCFQLKEFDLEQVKCSNSIIEVMKKYKNKANLTDIQLTEMPMYNFIYIPFEPVETTLNIIEKENCEKEKVLYHTDENGINYYTSCVTKITRFNQDMQYLLNRDIDWFDAFFNNESMQADPSNDNSDNKIYTYANLRMIKCNQIQSDGSYNTDAIIGQKNIDITDGFCNNNFPNN